MKRFLPLLILTGLLFGQDTTLVLKNGKTIEGTIVSETDNYYTIIVKSTSGGLINVDLPFFFGVRKDIYKIETLDRKEANAILNVRKEKEIIFTLFESIIAISVGAGCFLFFYSLFYSLFYTDLPF